MQSLKTWIFNHHTIVILALLLSILLGLFSAILEDVYESDSKVVLADNSISQYVATVRDPQLNSFFLNVTQLGNTEPLLLSFLLISILFLYFKKYNQLVTIFLTFGGSAVITFVIKNIVQRARPIEGLIVEHGFSFPSGHTFAAVCFWGVLFYLLATLTKNKPLKLLLYIFAVLVAFLIGFSRVYIGVHWPSDVIASYLLSTVYVVVVVLMVENKERIFKLFR